jgi:hypothetical protein
MNLPELEESQSIFDRSTRFWPRVAQWILVALGFGIIPIAFLVVALQVTKASGPQWLGSNFENPYMYLFNSLLVANGKPAYQYQHPGATTELFGALCLKLSGRGSGERLVKAVIDNPERTIKNLHRPLLVLCTAALWIFPLLAALRTRSATTGLLLQAPLLFFSTIYRYSIWYSSDLLLLVPSIATTSICVILLCEREEGAVHLMTCAFAGMSCGLGVATKLTFFPLILVAIFCCWGAKRLLSFAAGFCLAATLALIPIYSELQMAIDWVVALATHSGYYGGGDVGFPRADTYLPYIVLLISREPATILIALFATTATVALGLKARRLDVTSAGMSAAWTAVGIFILQIFSLLFIAKHASPHYLIPLYVSTGINLALLYRASQMLGGVGLPKLLVPGISIAVFAAGATHMFVTTPWLFETLSEYKRDQLAIHARVKQKTKDAIVVEYYRSISPEFALYFGDSFAGRAFSQELAARYPNHMFLSLWTGYFDTFSSLMDRDTITQKYRHLYFFGNRNQYTAEERANLKYFDAKGLSEIDSQGPYVLQEWIRPQD